MKNLNFTIQAVQVSISGYKLIMMVNYIHVFSLDDHALPSIGENVWLIIRRKA